MQKVYTVIYHETVHGEPSLVSIVGVFKNLIDAERAKRKECNVIKERYKKINQKLEINDTQFDSTMNCQYTSDYFHVYIELCDIKYTCTIETEMLELMRQIKESTTIFERNIRQVLLKLETKSVDFTEGINGDFDQLPCKIPCCNISNYCNSTYQYSAVKRVYLDNGKIYFDTVCCNAYSVHLMTPEDKISLFNVYNSIINKLNSK